MDTLTDSFESFLTGVLGMAPEIILAFLVLIAAHFIGRGVRKVYNRVLRKGDISATHLNFFGKLLYGVILLLGILLALNILGFYGLATSILASGGITAIILGFAFKDIGENFLAGFIMAFSRPFRTGDLIESEGVTGRVQNIELRHTHIRTGDGCDVFIPSAQLISKPLYNYTRDGLRRGSFVIGIDYSNDAEKACKLLLEAIKEDPKVIPDPEPTVRIDGFNPQFVELSVYFWIEVATSKQEIYLSMIKSRLMEVCRTTLIEHGYTFSSEVTSSLEMRELDVNLRQSKSGEEDN